MASNSGVTRRGQGKQAADRGDRALDESIAGAKERTSKKNFRKSWCRQYHSSRFHRSLHPTPT